MIGQPLLKGKESQPLLIGNPVSRPPRPPNHTAGHTAAHTRTPALGTSCVDGEYTCTGRVYLYRGGYTCTGHYRHACLYRGWYMQYTCTRHAYLHAALSLQQCHELHRSCPAVANRAVPIVRAPTASLLLIRRERLQQSCSCLIPVLPLARTPESNQLNPAIRCSPARPRHTGTLARPGTLAPGTPRHTHRHPCYLPYNQDLRHARPHQRTNDPHFRRSPVGALFVLRVLPRVLLAREQLLMRNCYNCRNCRNCTDQQISNPEGFQVRKALKSFESVA